MLRLGNTGLLGYSQFPKLLENLPSWVPDFTMPTKGAPLQDIGIYAASEEPFPDDISEAADEDSARLVLRGVAVTVIHQLGPALVDPVMEEREVSAPRGHSTRPDTPSAVLRSAPPPFPGGDLAHPHRRPPAGPYCVQAAGSKGTTSPPATSSGPGARTTRTPPPQPPWARTSSATGRAFSCRGAGASSA